MDNAGLNCGEYREYRVSGTPHAYTCLVSESHLGVVTARRKAFNDANFDYVMRHLQPHLGALKAFGTHTVTYISSHSLVDSEGQERADELALLLSPLLSDVENELYVFDAYGVYEADIPVIEKLGFVYRASMSTEDGKLYTLLQNEFKGK